MSIAFVFFFSRVDSLVNKASRKRGLASAPVAPGAGVRVTCWAVRISSFHLSAAGLRLSGCS